MRDGVGWIVGKMQNQNSGWQRGVYDRFVATKTATFKDKNTTGDILGHMSCYEKEHMYGLLDTPYPSFHHEKIIEALVPYELYTLFHDLLKARFRDITRDHNIITAP